MNTRTVNDASGDGFNVEIKMLNEMIITLLFQEMKGLIAQHQQSFAFSCASKSAESIIHIFSNVHKNTAKIKKQFL